jgi:hypothetical protein
MRGPSAKGLAVAATLLLAACGNAPGVYDLPVHDAYQRLAANKLKDFRANEQCGILIELEPSGVADRSVTWTVMSEGEEQFHFAANLTPVGSGKTKVDVDILKDPAGREFYDGTKTYLRPALMQPVRPRIEEAIAAVLEDRPYDLGHVKHAGWDDVCGVQRGKIASGHGPFSIHDQPGDD